MDRHRDAPPEDRERLEAAERTLAACRVAAAALTEEPRGWTEVRDDTALVALLARPVVGLTGPGYERKEAAILAHIRGMAPADCRVIVDRIKRNRPGDPIAAGPRDRARRAGERVRGCRRIGHGRQFVFGPMVSIGSSHVTPWRVQR